MNLTSAAATDNEVKYHSNRTAVTLSIVGAVVLAVALAVVTVTPASAAPTEIDACTRIDTPGVYRLTTDIENSADDQCIVIESSDVLLDGAGHTIDGVDDFPTTGIAVIGRTFNADNVTVRNSVLTDWGTGIAYETASGAIRDSVVASNSRGISFTYGAYSVTVENTTARGNDVDGFYVQDSSANRFVNVAASDNGQWAYSSVSDPREGSSADNTVEDLMLDSATVSFESKDIELGAVESPPADPEGLRNVGGYVNVSATSENAYLDLSVRYTDTDAADIGERSLRLFAFADGKWSPVPRSTVNPKANVVSANVTALGDATVLAPLGEPPSEEPTSETETDTQSSTGERLPNTITVESTADERVFYDFTASGRVEPGPKANLVEAEIPDTIDGSTAAGSVALRGVDDYRFAGEITALSLDGSDVQVSINGETVDPTDFQSKPETATPTPVSTTTLVPTATTTTMAPTSTATSTSTGPPASSTLSTTVNPSSTPTPTVRSTTSLRATPTGTQTPPENVTTTSGVTATDRRITSPTGATTDQQTDAFGPGFGMSFTAIVAIAAVIARLLTVRRRE